MSDWGRLVLLLGYQLASLATFVFISFFDGYVYNWWNWIIAIPVTVVFAEIWPLYWAIIRWIPGVGH